MEPLRPCPCPEKTRADLEWDRLLGALASRCLGPMGRALALALPFSSSREETRRLLGEAEEASRLFADGEPLPVLELPDVRDAIARARVGGVLSPIELRALGRTLETARTLRRFLSTRRAQAPRLHSALTTDPTLDALADELLSSFDADGTLSDRASPRLKELRGEYRAGRARMIARLEDLMKKYGSVLQDSFVTEREGRWVIPVRSDAHERFPGLVHGTSASGATLFVEPRAVIPMGNRMKVLEADVTREEIAVYTRLSAAVADSLPSVEACAEALATADVRAATGRLAHELALRFPSVVDEPRLELRDARHPLLALEGVSVVPSDARIEAGRAMVVSGPNAGGKTVALKTMGLSALMVRAGLPVACGDGSVVGLFDVVLSDVGDDQSLHRNLSTFSAHVQNLAAILQDTQPGALVLLDEVATGTDPREGEALAAGVLDSLTARGGAVVATTHYEGLKALALADARFENASVGFDFSTMTPTFRLARGVPGSSSALSVARRFGIPGTVIERAERFLSREDRNFEALVRKLNDERAALELARASFERKVEELDLARARLEEETERARDRERRELTREVESLRAGVLRARDDLRVAQAALRQKRHDPESLRQAEKALVSASSGMALGGALSPLVGPKGDEAPRNPLPAERLKKGARAWVSRLRAEAEILELLDDGSVRVAAGALKLVVPRDDLFTPEPRTEGPSRGRGKERGLAPAQGPEVAIQTEDNTCDLRGLRTDDALSLATTFLDRALNNGLRVCFLVHGHGTGAIREALRKELKQSPYVAQFRPGTQHEGGDGATVVHLA